MIDKQLVVALDVANKNELLKVLDVLPDTISNAPYTIFSDVDFFPSSIILFINFARTKS